MDSLIINDLSELWAWVAPRPVQGSLTLFDTRNAAYVFTIPRNLKVLCYNAGLKSIVPSASTVNDRKTLWDSMSMVEGLVRNSMLLIDARVIMNYVSCLIPRDSIVT